MATLHELTCLARKVADPLVDACILAEGNVSARADENSIWIKGSGIQMQQANESAFAHVRLTQILEALDTDLDEITARELLNSAALGGPAPSTETFMHAWIVQHCRAEYVAHTHPTTLLSILSLANARELATKRLFPDEIVCCGPAACWVPYVAPGHLLARAIRDATTKFESIHGVPPKTYWLQNHGLICWGATTSEVEAALLMSIKAARVLLGSLGSGREVTFLTDDQAAQIYRWPDEHERQKRMWK